MPNRIAAKTWPPHEGCENIDHVFLTRRPVVQPSTTAGDHVHITTSTTVEVTTTTTTATTVATEVEGFSLTTEASLSDITGERMSSRFDKSFPEFQEQFFIERAHDCKEKVGVCLSGGGSRAAVSSLGQFRALHDIALKRTEMDRVTSFGREISSGLNFDSSSFVAVGDREKKLADEILYLSCVSGGSWFATPYTFFNKRDMSVDSFLAFPTGCNYHEPSTLSISYNKPSVFPPTSFGRHAQGVDFHKLIYFSPNFIPNRRFADANGKWNALIGEHFVEPFVNIRQREIGYPTNTCVDKNEPRANVPFLIANATLVTADESIFRKRPLVVADDPKLAQVLCRGSPFEMTPLYVGYSQLYNLSFSKHCIMGGYFECHAMNGIDHQFDPPGVLPRVVHFEPQTVLDLRFTLEDLAGTSSATIAGLLDGIMHLMPVSPFESYSMPQPLHRHELPSEETEYLDGECFTLSDGGNFDNLGIIPLLKRGVRKIVAFENTAELDSSFRLHPDTTPKFRERVVKGFLDVYFRDRSISNLFGLSKTEIQTVHQSVWKAFLPEENPPVMTRDNFGFDDGVGSLSTGDGLPKLLHVLTHPMFPARNVDAFKELLIDAINCCLSGEPIIVRGTYQTVENKYVGLKPKTTQPVLPIEIIWVFNACCRKWYQQLTPSQRSLMAPEKGSHNSLSNFPHYSTTDELNLNSIKVEYLAAMHAWNMTEKADLFQELFA